MSAGSQLVCGRDRRSPISAGLAPQAEVRIALMSRINVRFQCSFPSTTPTVRWCFNGLNGHADLDTRVLEIVLDRFAANRMWGGARKGQELLPGRGSASRVDHQCRCSQGD